MSCRANRNSWVSGASGAHGQAWRWSEDKLDRLEGRFARSGVFSVPLAQHNLPCANDRMTISLAENEVQRNSARTLLNRSYAWRGYGDQHEIKSDAYHTTFTASYEGEIIGTLTLGVDSPSGLAIDNTFRDV